MRRSGFVFSQCDIHLSSPRVREAPPTDAGEVYTQCYISRMETFKKKPLSLSLLLIVVQNVNALLITGKAK